MKPCQNRLENPKFSWIKKKKRKTTFHCRSPHSSDIACFSHANTLFQSARPLLLSSKRHDHNILWFKNGGSC